MYGFAGRFVTLHLGVVKRKRTSMKSDYNRTYEFPPIAVAIPPCEFSVFVNVRIGLYISSVKIPNGKIFQMVRHLCRISSLPPMHESARTTVYQCGSRLCGVRLEAGIVSPFHVPYHRSHALFGYTAGMILSDIILVFNKSRFPLRSEEHTSELQS